MRIAPCLLALLIQSLAASPISAHADSERGIFAPCVGPERITCVVDGDTFWYRGTKIRIADINAPEVSRPRCPAEAELGARAAARLTELLNRGRFALAAQGGDADRHGRKLRVVTRRGASLGARLEADGLAEHWNGRRRDWCRG